MRVTDALSLPYEKEAHGWEQALVATRQHTHTSHNAHPPQHHSWGKMCFATVVPTMPRAVSEK